jgi:hypothetical protein
MRAQQRVNEENDSLIVLTATRIQKIIDCFWTEEPGFWIVPVADALKFIVFHEVLHYFFGILKPLSHLMDVHVSDAWYRLWQRTNSLMKRQKRN